MTTNSTRNQPPGDFADLPKDLSSPVMLTIDACAMKSKHPDANVRRLLSWEREGLVRLCRCTRLGMETGNYEPAKRRLQTMRNVAEPFTLDMSAFGSDARFASKRGLDFAALALVLFPGRDARDLTSNQSNDVMYLISHHAAACDVFVTENTRDFVRGRRREALAARWGIVVMTLPEIVESLERRFGWR